MATSNLAFLCYLETGKTREREVSLPRYDRTRGQPSCTNNNIFLLNKISSPWNRFIIDRLRLLRPAMASENIIWYQSYEWEVIKGHSTAFCEPISAWRPTNNGLGPGRRTSSILSKLADDFEWGRRSLHRRTEHWKQRKMMKNESKWKNCKSTKIVIHTNLNYLCHLTAIMEPTNC